MQSKIEREIEKLMCSDMTSLECFRWANRLVRLVREEEREEIMGKSQLETYPFIDDGILHAFNVWVVPRRALDPKGTTEPPDKKAE